MTDAGTTTDFWAIVEGRAQPPASARLLNWRFVGFDEAAGVLSCAFEATEAFLNPVGLVQGGLLAAMLDEATGPVAAAVSRGALLAQTLEMKVSYMRAARAGVIYGEGRILQRGREIMFLEGRLLDPEKRVIAIATATARAITPAAS
jgi:uncharacterized protein (TIGR00369 family)